MNNNNNNTIIHHYGGRDGKRIELNKFHIVHPLCRKISLFKLFSLLSHHIENPFLLHMYISHHSHSIKSLIFTAEAASTRMSKKEEEMRCGRLEEKMKDEKWGVFAVIFRTDIEVSEWVRKGNRKAAVQWTVNVWRKENFFVLLLWSWMLDKSLNVKKISRI